MNHLKKLKGDRMLARAEQLEAEATQLRKEASKLPKRYWQRRNRLRAEASQKMQWVRDLWALAYH